MCAEMMRAIAISAMAFAGTIATAYEPGQSDYVFSSDLVAQGFASLKLRVALITL
jgi:hypothetical protein